MSKPKIISSAEVTPPRRKSPAKKIMEELDGDYLGYREMAEHVGVHVETMRRLCKAKDEFGNKRVKAPSAATQVGGMVIYLFTKEDVQEIEEYFRHKGYVFGTESE